jgi:hypothetical protein
MIEIIVGFDTSARLSTNTSARLNTSTSLRNTFGKAQCIANIYFRSLSACFKAGVSKRAA